MRHIRIHDLRHTFASLLIANGESLAYVKDLRFAKALSDAVEAPDIFVDAISKLYDEAEQELGPMADNIEIHRYLEILDRHPH